MISVLVNSPNRQIKPVGICANELISYGALLSCRCSHLSQLARWFISGSNIVMRMLLPHIRQKRSSCKPSIKPRGVSTIASLIPSVGWLDLFISISKVVDGPGFEPVSCDYLSVSDTVYFVAKAFHSPVRMPPRLPPKLLSNLHNTLDPIANFTQNRLHSFAHSD
jgi:hypothetical protein